MSNVEVLDALPRGPAKHGGARKGAGAKPAGYVKSDAAMSFDEARTRNEAAKASLNELELKIKSKEYVAIASVVQSMATAYSAIAQTLRSIPDNLERKINLDPTVAEEVGRVIDEALADLSNEMELLGGGSDA